MRQTFWNAPYWVALAAIGQLVAGFAAAWAARLAQRSAKLAQRSVDIMDAAMQNGDRAYVAMENTSVGFESHGSPPVFVTTLRNAGKTPAHEVRFGFHVLLVNSIDEAKNYGVQFDDGRTSLAPGAALNTLGCLPETLSPDESSALAAGRVFLIGLGETIYKDIFGHEHKTAWGVQFKQDAPSHFVMTGFHNFMN